MKRSGKIQHCRNLNLLSRKDDAHGSGTSCQSKSCIGKRILQSEGWKDGERTGSIPYDKIQRKLACPWRKHKSTSFTEKIAVAGVYVTQPVCDTG